MQWLLTFGYRVALALLPLTAVWLLGTVVLIMWHGGRWTYTIPALQWTLTAATPVPRMVWAALCLLAWHLLRQIRRRQVRWRDLMGKAALLAVSLSLSFVGAEWAFRRYLQHSQGFNTIEKLVEYEEDGVIRPRSRHPLSLLITLSPNRRLIYELRRNMDKIFGPERVVTNSAGMRESTEYSLAPPEGAFRIVGIGDSGMFGWDVPQDGDYLGLLESSLNEGARDNRLFEVLNFAVPGYNLQQQVELFSYRAMEYRPDLVVVGWCDNDFDAPFFMYQPRDYSRLGRSLIYALLFRRESFYRLTKPEVHMYTTLRGEPIHPDIEAGMGVEGVVRSFARLQELSRQEGFEVIVFGPMNDDAEEVCSKLGMNCYNTREKVSAGDFPPEYGVHEMHPSAEGHAVLAEHLEGALGHFNLLPL